MHTSRNTRIALVLMVVSSLLLAACAGGTPAPSAAPAAAEPAAQEAPAAAPAAAGSELPIGIAVAQTSNVSLFGQEQVLGAQMAEKYFNENGGVNGTPIKLIFQDTAGDEAGTINAYQTLINDNVIAIVGPTLSQQAFAANPFAEKAGVPVIAPSNTAKGIPEMGKYISRVSAPVAKVAPNAIEAALAINPDIKKVAVAYAQNDAFSNSETGTFQGVITGTYNLDLATVQTFQTTDTDFTTQASNIMNVQPDLVVISGLAADGANLIKQLRDLGYTGLIVGGNGLNTANIFPVCQKQCDGLLVAQAYSPKLDSAINKMLVDTYSAEQGKTPGQFTAQAFAAVQVLVEGLRAVDQKTPIKDMALADLRNALNEQLLSGMTFDTPLGEISFDPEGELNQSQFYVAQIKMDSEGKTGEFVLVK